MKLPKTLLGAMLVGVAVQATGCQKNDPQPKEKQTVKQGSKSAAPPANCPACGMG
jgi:hypothetical protein